MRWNHLPVAGGLYDQHPEFVRKINIIFDERNKEERRKERKKDFETGRNRGSPRVAGRR